jgi:putative CocE/NonD family hydrolase
VRVDPRGSGDSEGLLTDEYLELELTDGEDVIAWLAEQSWCDGTVGIMGISWGGFNGLQLTARRPPALGAIITVASTDDRYADDVHYMGGCLLGDNLSWARRCSPTTRCPRIPRSRRTGANAGTIGCREASCGWTQRDTVQESDVTSARGETIWERTMERGDWQVRTVARTVLTCDVEAFHLHATLDAFDGEERVHSSNVSRRIPRRLV